MHVDGRDVTREIRTTEVTAATHFAANNPGVRGHLVELQRQAAGTDNIVTEGRDQGTVVFPHAECKIYLTASPEELARRRAHELAAHGEPTTIDEVLKHQNQRDQRNASRSVGPMVAAEDAIEVPTDGLTPDAVLDRLESLVRGTMKNRSRALNFRQCPDRYPIDCGRLYSSFWRRLGFVAIFNLRCQGASGCRRAAEPWCCQIIKAISIRSLSAWRATAGSTMWPGRPCSISRRFVGCSNRWTRFQSIARESAWAGSKRRSSGSRPGGSAVVSRGNPHARWRGASYQGRLLHDRARSRVPLVPVAIDGAFAAWPRRHAFRGGP